MIYLEGSSEVWSPTSEEKEPYKYEHVEYPLSVHYSVYHNSGVFPNDDVNSRADKL